MLREARDNYDWWKQLVDPQCSVCVAPSSEAAGLIQAIGEIAEQRMAYMRKLSEIHRREEVMSYLDNTYVDYGMDRFKFDFPVVWYFAERIRSKKWF